MNCSDLYTETKQKNTNLLRNSSETIAHLKFHFLKWLWKSEAREENKPFNRVLSRYRLKTRTVERSICEHFEVDKDHEIILPMQSSFSSWIR